MSKLDKLFYLRTLITLRYNCITSQKDVKNALFYQGDILYSKYISKKRD